MDRTSARVLGILALLGAVLFLATSLARLTRADVDVVLVILNSALGLLLLVAGTDSGGSQAAGLANKTCRAIFRNLPAKSKAQCALKVRLLLARVSSEFIFKGDASGGRSPTGQDTVAN